MGGNGVNFNAPKDTTRVRKFDSQKVLNAAVEGGLKGAGVGNSIFTNGKVNNTASHHIDYYENGVKVGEQELPVSNNFEAVGIVHYAPTEYGVVEGKASYTDEVSVEGNIFGKEK